MILTNPELTPIEVKLSETKSKSLELFMRKFKAKKGYVVTSSQEVAQKSGVQAMPAYKYLLNAQK